jgi:hypothetical protein
MREKEIIRGMSDEDLSEMEDEIREIRGLLDEA